MKTYPGCSQKPIYKYILNSKSKKNRYPLRLLICLMEGVTLLIYCYCLGLAKDRNVVVNELNAMWLELLLLKTCHTDMVRGQDHTRQILFSLPSSFQNQTYI